MALGNADWFRKWHISDNSHLKAVDIRLAFRYLCDVYHNNKPDSENNSRAFEK